MVGDMKSEARSILDKFAKELKSVKTSDITREFDHKDTVREEKHADGANSLFRTAILKNAPRSDDECIIAEKGTWTK